MAKRVALVICIVFASFMAISCSKGDGEPKHVESNSAPSFVLNDISGAKVDLADYRGKVVVLDFFATWCEPCRMLAPELKAFDDKYKDKGVAVIAISIDEGADAAAMVRDYKKEYRLAYAMAVDDGKVKKQYNVFSLPTTVIIDRDGKIRSKHLGITADYAKRLSVEVEPLLR